MANERKTEIIVRNLLNKKGYYADKFITVEEQQSDSLKIKKLLSNASKSGSKNGYPEFIITCSRYPELIILVECKADVKKHESGYRNKYKDFAVDGVLLYSSFVSKEFDVLSIAVSGEDLNNCVVSQYLQLKGSKEQHKVLNSDILSFDEYHEWIMKSDIKYNQDYASLAVYTKKLNEQLHEKKIKESQRALLISGILIALKNDAFKTSYLKHKNVTSLIKSLIGTINSELTENNIPGAKVEVLTQAFSFISTNTTLNNSKDGKSFLEQLITDIDKEINGFMQTYKFVDTVSQFYVEFLRYANHDKGLGIVLTPSHITDLFIEIAEVDKNTVLFDNCCGTGGFLISGMKKMLLDANGNIDIEKRIKENQLVGIEFQDDIFALLVSNMIIHRDGRSNIYWGSCFDKLQEIKEKYTPTVGILNPPYKSKKSDRDEWEFIFNNLEALESGGTCIALVPISCAIQNSGDTFIWKEKLLENHTLEAVVSLPEELFYNSKVSTVTCGIIITAHKPHPRGKKTWFGYWRNDGFEKNKNQGRADLKHTWSDIKEYWVNTFRNKEVIDGYSAMRCVTAEDEWCVEAYLETDYKLINKNDYENTIKEFLLFSMRAVEGGNDEIS